MKFILFVEGETEKKVFPSFFALSGKRGWPVVCLPAGFKTAAPGVDCL